jgi:hypothetical protein
MQVNIKARYGIIGKSVKYFEEISNVSDLQRVIKALVTTSDAWINDIQVVGRGYVKMFAYNHQQELVDVLTGKTKELHADINRTV